MRPLIARPDSTLTRATRFARSPVGKNYHADTSGPEKGGPGRPEGFEDEGAVRRGAGVPFRGAVAGADGERELGEVSRSAGRVFEGAGGGVLWVGGGRVCRWGGHAGERRREAGVESESIEGGRGPGDEEAEAAKRL